MTRFARVATRLGSFASRAVVGISVTALVAATVVSQLGVLAGSRTLLAGRSVLSPAGVFAALAITQALVYGMIVLASVAPAVRRLAAAGRSEALSVPTVAGDDLRLRQWLVAWAVAAMALRAALAYGAGVAALLSSP